MTRRASQQQVSCRAFGFLPGGAAVELYTLRNSAGMQVQIATYGGIVTSILVPDSAGHVADVVLGNETLDLYLSNNDYFGALIGRYANRISRGQLRLNGNTYRLSTNDGPHSLHGGKAGFDKVVWTVGEARITSQGPQLLLSHTSPDGDEGYPGELLVTATYTLLKNNALRLSFTALANKTTVVNLTGHSYFNLAGSGDVLNHEVKIYADRFTPLGPDRIPSGEMRDVTGTPFDFRESTNIGARIDSQDEQLTLCGGYDHNWVLKGEPEVLRPNAIVYEPVSGRVLEILSDQPGIQFYSGNFLNGLNPGKGGWRYERRHGVCFEPQQFPNAPNEAKFPSPVLTPGQPYRCSIVYRFSAVAAAASRR